MLNLNELESRWLRYKIKSYIPYFIILTTIIIFLVIYSVADFDLSKKNETTIIIKEKVTLPKIESTIIQNKKEVSNPPIEKKVHIEAKQISKEPILETNKQEKLLIEPSLSFMNNIQRTSPQHYYDEVPKRFNNSKKEVKSFEKTKKQTTITQASKITKKELIVDAPETEVVENSTISIKRQNTNEDIQHVIKRFKKSNNPALSLFVAKKYYELENYNAAYNYSLITNELNNDIEESWIIFSKSLVKLGKKDKAIEVLKKYIKNSHSQRANLLLNNIKSGKLK